MKNRMASGAGENPTSSSFKSKLLHTLKVISAEECNYLLTLGIDFPSSVPGVVSAIDTLVKATMRGEFNPDNFSLTDKEGDLVKFHEKRFIQGWAPRRFSLNGTTLEYRKVSKKPSKAEDHRIINLTPECCIVETGLSAAEKKHGFVLVTPNKVLQLACPSFADKMAWVAALARAILVPRQKSLGVTQISLFRGSLATEVDEVDPSLAAKIKGLGIVVSDSVKISVPPEKTAKRFVALQAHFLQLWKDEAVYTAGKRPVAYIFLDHSMKVMQRNETTLEIRSAIDSQGKAVYMDFESKDKCQMWKTTIHGDIAHLRAALKNYLSFFKEGVPRTQRTPRQAPPTPRIPLPTQQAITPSPIQSAMTVEKVEPTIVEQAVEEKAPEPVKVVERQDTPVVVDPIVPPAEVQSPSVETPLVVEMKQEPSAATIENASVEKVEVDPRPVVELRLRRLDATGKSVNGEQEKETFATIHVNLDDNLVCVRDEIYTQVDPDKIPTHFSFVRFAGELQMNLMASLAENPGTVLTLSQEEDLTVAKCLIQDKYLLLSCPDELIQRCTNSAEDWERERKAYQQQIRHLEAQLAEARRALHEKAKALKRSDESHESRSHLFTSLCSLQRDGFLDADVNVDDLEYKYLCVFYEEDALKAFAFSPNSPLRVVWRRICADPERMRKYIEDLENFVLKKYRIRKERLGAPYWATNVLRDGRFVEDSSRFQEWAKTEPWCEDDAERYVYLTGKLFYVSESNDEFAILARGRPTEPPQREKPKDDPAAVSTTQTREAFKQERPASFMASADALDAMKRFQDRKSKSARALPTKIVEGSAIDPAPAIPASKPLAQNEVAKPAPGGEETKSAD